MAGYSNYRRDSAKYTSKINLFKVERNHRKNGESKTDKFNRQMHIWVAYYRANPHRFAKEFLGLNLHLFQAILLWGMMHHNIFMFIASRGIGSEYPRRRDKHGGFIFTQEEMDYIRENIDTMHYSEIANTFSQWRGFKITPRQVSGKANNMGLKQFSPKMYDRNFF